MCCFYMVHEFANPYVKPWIQFNHYEDIYENSANLSKVTPVYSTNNIWTIIMTNDNNDGSTVI